MPPAEAPSKPRSAPSTGERPAAARRTVVITGQTSGVRGTHVVGRPGPERRRPPRRASERIAGSRPDRAALWAVLMGVFLILVAVMTAHGA